MKTTFTVDEMTTAVHELRKLWNYHNCDGDAYRFMSEEEKKRSDERTCGFGIKLGTLRKLYGEDNVA
jgi:hypothetical protein